MASIESGELAFVKGGNSGSSSTQLIALADGNTLMVWVGPTSGGGFEAFGKVVDSAGDPVGNTFRLSQSNAGEGISSIDTAKIDDGHVAIVFNTHLGGGGSAPITAAIFDPLAMALSANASIPQTHTIDRMASDAFPGTRAYVDVVNGKLAVLWESYDADSTQAFGAVYDNQFEQVLVPAKIVETSQGIGDVVSIGNALGVTTGNVITFLDSTLTGVEGGVVYPNGESERYSYFAPQALGVGVITGFQAHDSYGNSYELRIVGYHVNGSWAPEGGSSKMIVPYVVGDKIVAVYGDRAQVLSYDFNTDLGYTTYVFSAEGPEFTIDSDNYPDDIVAQGNGFLAVWREGMGDRDIVGQFFTTDGVETGLLTEGDAGGDIVAGTNIEPLAGNVLGNDVGNGKTVTDVDGHAVGTNTTILGTYGTLTIWADGTYTYKADQPAAIALKENIGFQEHFTYRASSIDGDSDNAVLSFNVIGRFDGGARNIALSNNSVLESPYPGQEVGRVTSEGEEDFTYELIDNTGKPFAIDENTGVISTIAELDREAHSSYTLTVKLTGEVSGIETTQNFDIDVADVDEVPYKPSLITTSALTKAGNDYRATGGTTGKLATLSATDPEGDVVHYILDAKLAVQGEYVPSNAFTIIDSELRANGPLQAGYYYLYINAEDSASNTSETLIFGLSVSPPPEPPVITSNGGGATALVTVDENTTAVTKVQASSGYPGYSISGGADAAKFNIDYGTGQVTFKAAPNFEVPGDANGDNTYEVKVRASSGDLFDQQTITVRVADVNEALPVIVSNGAGATASVSLMENTRTVTTVIASDADGSSSLNYAISGGDDAALFTINATTGALTFKSAPNFEAAADKNKDNVYDVIVRASDGGFSDTQRLAVRVTDANEFTPVISSNGGGTSASISILENAKTVTTVRATDADTSAKVTYSIAGGADKALFAIDATTGALAFKTAPNFEAPTDVGKNNVYDVIVQASDGSKFDQQSLVIKVGNVNEFAPVISSNGGGTSANISILENVKAVTTVKATDADASAKMTYSIAGGTDKSLFTIDATTGALAFKTAPNFEAPKDAGKNNVYDVIVKASDGTKFDQQTLAIKVGNVNEFAPVITSNGGSTTAAVSVNEGVKTVTTVKATDADTGTVLNYAISGGADKGLFTINATTGALTFKTAPNFDVPKDAGKNNVYDVAVSASDGTRVDTQNIAVKVKDVSALSKVTADAGETFTFTKESSKSGSHVISGFTSGLDRIDLSRIDADPASGDQVLRFVSAFTPAKAGEADGQVRVIDHGRDVKVEIDWDGNGRTDLTLTVLDIAKLHAGDFIL